MAGRRVCSINKAVAVAMAVVALLAMLFAAGKADDCKVNKRTVLMQCASACSGGGDPTPTKGCCDSLANADYGCLCRNYWNQLKSAGYGDCAKAIPSKCNPNAPKSC